MFWTAKYCLSPNTTLFNYIHISLSQLFYISLIFLNVVHFQFVFLLAFSHRHWNAMNAVTVRPKPPPPISTL